MPKRKRECKKLKREDVQQVVSMGFSEEVAKAALQSNSNVQDALNDLLDQIGEEDTSSYLSSESKRTRTSSPITSGNGLSENLKEESKSVTDEKIYKKKDVLPVTLTGDPQKSSSDPVLNFSKTNDLATKYEALKEQYEKDRSHLLKEQKKIDEKITWMRPQSERFKLVKTFVNWSKGDDNDIVLWHKKQWLDEEELLNAELKRYENQLEMFDEQLKYIDHMFQRKTIQFENEKTVAKLVSLDIKNGQRMNADDRNILLLSSAGKILHDKYNCEICFCEYEVKDFAFLSCMHGFCRSCLKMMITTKVKDGLLQNLYCPNIDEEGNSCKHRLTHEEVRLFIGEEELFKKYERLQLHQTLNQTEDCRWCPRPGCETAMFGNKLTPMMTCPKCEMKFCFNCKTSDWHPGTTCEKFQQWSKENSQGDAKFESWKDKNTSPCPKCKASIEKNGGCMHMTCSNCKYEWHWLTGEKWRGYDASYAAPVRANEVYENNPAELINAFAHDNENQFVPPHWLRQIVNIIIEHGNPNLNPHFSI